MAPISQSDIDNVVHRLQELLHSHRTPVLVALAGIPGSGKTTVASFIVDALQHCGISTICVPMDGYHLYRKVLSAMPNAAEAFCRRGAEWTFDRRKLEKDLRILKQTGRLSAPSFEHAVKDPVENCIHVTEKHQVVIVEGLYLLHRGTEGWDAVTNLFDLRLFLRCPLEDCVGRLVARHMKAWGISRKDAEERLLRNDLLNARLVATTEGAADIVLASVRDPHLSNNKPKL